MDPKNISRVSPEADMGSEEVKRLHPGDKCVQAGAMVEEIKNRPTEALCEKFHIGILKGVRNISDTVKQRCDISRVRGKIGYFPPPEPWCAWTRACCACLSSRSAG